jgi:GH15 family glucan-1,4-alpha-glucosidase
MPFATKLRQPRRSLSLVARPQHGTRDNERVDGYLTLRGYAAIGDGRTLALVGRDGAIDWLCTPELDSESMFGALLDARRGGSATVHPTESFAVERRYVRDTNVLETTFTTSLGALRITDAMQIDDRRDAPFRTILRRVECVAGTIDVAWGVRPRFSFGEIAPDVAPAGNGACLSGGGQTARVHAFDLGVPTLDPDGAQGHVNMRLGDRGLLALVVGPEPPDRGRAAFERDLDEAARWWRAWAARVAYDGPWRDAVLRSSLVLRLLVNSGTGAILAAGTTSVPEVPGGVRNWDYRFSWVRDSLLVLDAFFAVGCESEATAYFEWLRDRLEPDTGRISVLYDLRGAECAPERELPLAGWRGARPVRVGNSAASQYQQSTYGTLLHACHLYASRAHGGLPSAQRRTFLQAAELLSRVWSEPDAGIWEERGPHRQHTHSKMMSVLGLHCAADLARQGGLDRGFVQRLAAASAAAARFVDASCVDPASGAYTRTAHGDTFDAAVLMPLGMGYGRWGGPGRVERTIDVIRERLGDGAPLLYRYREDDGLPGQEGRFIPCSFWLAGALGHCGRAEEAAAVLDAVIPLANDVGLFSEELDHDGAFLGNLPQALTHASLVSAATAVGDAAGPSGRASAWKRG